MADSSLGVFGGYYGVQKLATETQMLQELAPIEVSQARAKLQETQLDIKQKNFDLLNAETLFARQQRMIRQMDSKHNSGSGPEGQASSEAENSAKLLLEQSQIERDNGFFKESTETASKAVGILENNSKIQTRAANLQIKMFSDVRNLLDGVHSERDWDELRTKFPLLHPDEAKLPGVQQILRMKYNSQMVKAVSDSLTSQKERAQTAAALADAKSRTAAANKDDAYVRDYLPKLEDLAEARSKAVRKAGGKKVSSSNVSAMQKDILALYPDGDPQRAYLLAGNLAEDAAILQTRMGVSKAKAQELAIHQAGRSYFANIQGVTGVGSSPEKPLSLPEDSDVKKLKDGRYYINGSGKVRVWDAKAGGFVEPNARALSAEQDSPEELPIDLDGDDKE